ncbi:unnamed protein product [Lepeophtheirus salmonis]|uniref:(salmon louse) hypothetical protein n=1 Tax=Lepeophtheirus salmonis TaxID=72036 RepID=A0A7R8CYZ0_LEPSM|nr:unnamed protein product [Lepeophtheirus salmonis]CAF2971779.1 unnamed protein product [Lepeophtheirus salmonis]
MLESKALALKRFNKLESSFRRRTEFGNAYRNAMQSNFHFGFTKVIPYDEVAIKDNMYIAYVFKKTTRSFAFFWRLKINGPFKEYHHTRQVFGAAVNFIDNDMYMDDLITGTSDIIEAKQIVDQLIKIHSYGQFQLRKWCSNILEVISHLPDE